MRTKMISILLAAALIASLLAGCSAGADNSASLSRSRIQPLSMDLSNAPDVGMSRFDSALIEFLKQTGKADENFAVSPLSLKAALALAAAGTDGALRESLLSAMDFASVEEMDAWFAGTVETADQVAELFRGPIAGSTGAVYEIMNSVWRNESLPGTFQESFRQTVEETYRAEVRSAAADQITDAINAWVNEKTRGLIPKIVANASDSAVVLVNAIYLKDAWVDSFQPSAQTEFTAADGKLVEKPFMEREGRYRYYEDDNCQIVEIPMNGGLSMVFVLGEEEGFAEKLNQAESRLARVVLPKFDVETSFEDNELCTFLATMGCDALFNGTGDLSAMCTSPVTLDGILQKTKVRIDEEGMEAAAATAIITKGAMPPAPEDPVLFQADRPFSFYVLDSGENPNVVFWGQIVK